MKELLFFLRVYIKKPVIWLSAAVILAITFFSFSTESMTETLPCAVFSCDGSEEAGKIVSYLCEKGFVRCESEEEVYEKVRNGTADSGVVLNENLADQLVRDRLDNCAKLIVSERSANTSAYKLMAAAAVYRELMPYKAAAVAADMGYETEPEEILAYSDEVRSSVNPLDFNIVTVEGESALETENYDLQTGVTAIVFFVMLGMLCTAMIRKNSTAVRQRFSSQAVYFSKCLLPQCAAAGIMAFAAAAAGLLAASVFYTVPVAKMTIALFLYSAVLVFAFALVSLLPVSSRILICAIAIDAAVSLILCPLYGGTNLALKYIGPLRAVSVPYLMYHFLFL